ncbi:related to monocarboxylate transporter 4 [Rhynchosporium agropyri]|uniref:Related to monocarboxylate transporter 4 n=1 Tax=Rhynchosporium agropyri TaxID=914238 RepID=A0A1E1LJE0_9HELO|nr:related to monocarboxylate transporter 4 [Rhynchosporium agropyri]
MTIPQPRLDSSGVNRTAEDGGQSIRASASPSSSYELAQNGDVVEDLERKLTDTEKRDGDGIYTPRGDGWDGNVDDRKGRKEGGKVTRILTKSSWKDLGPPPDGGWFAWMQAAFGHLVIMNTWGFINSFGVFQTYYVTSLNRAPSDISWIGSIQIFFLFFVGTFTGRLTDAGYFRPVFLLGSVLAVFGTFMASLSTSYWQLFLAQGVCCGLGNGCLFCPSLSLLSTYFSSKRGLALGIGAAGSATGGMVFPAMVSSLLPKIGFPWTMRALGFIQLGCLVICNIGIKPRMPPRRTGALVDWKSFKEVPYVLFAIGMFFSFWAVYFAFYYVGSFARNVIGLPYKESVNLLIVMNGLGTIGRIVPGHVADRYWGPINTLTLFTFMTSILVLCWIAVGSKGGLYGWAVVYGTTAAGIQSLFPVALSSLTTDLTMAGTRMGLVFTIVSFAVLTGPPICGQLIQRKNGEYEYAMIFAGSVLMVGGGFLSAARFARSRELRAKI